MLLCAVIVSLWLYNCYIYRLVQSLTGAAVCCHCQPVVILLLHLQAGSGPVRSCCVLSLTACGYIIVIFNGWFRVCQMLLCVVIVRLLLYFVIFTVWLESVRCCCVLPLTACGYIIVIFTGWFRASQVLLCAAIISLIISTWISWTKLCKEDYRRSYATNAYIVTFVVVSCKKTYLLFSNNMRQNLFFIISIKFRFNNKLYN